MARVVFWVSPAKDKGWQVRREGEERIVSGHARKEDAIDEAIRLAKQGELGQVKIQKADGRIETEHTYGQDPPEKVG